MFIILLVCLILCLSVIIIILFYNSEPNILCTRYKAFKKIKQYEKENNSHIFVITSDSHFTELHSKYIDSTVLGNCFNLNTNILNINDDDHFLKCMHYIYCKKVKQLDVIVHTK